MRRLCNAVCFAASICLPGLAGAQVVPVVECREDVSLSAVRIWFGYVNSASAPVTLEAGTGVNFFLPQPGDRGQPSVFEPGSHRRVFAVDIPSGSTLRWVLHGLNSGNGIANSSTPLCDAPRWRGPWDPTASYLTNELVGYLGSSWIATEASTGEPPDASASWGLVAQKGDTGAQGEPGLMGLPGIQGPPGPQGPQGVPGENQVFPASGVYRVPANGRLVVSDPNVKADSVIVASYVGGQLLPPAVVDVTDGALTIVGLPGRRIRYVVFK